MTLVWWVLLLKLDIGTVVVIDKEFVKDGERYKSKVIDRSDESVMIDYPTNTATGKTAFFIDGTQLLVTFNDQHTSYAFKTEVIGRKKQGIPMLQLHYPGDNQLIRIQRREFVRVETAVDVAVSDEHRTQSYVTVDVSAGGLALPVDDETFLEENRLLTLLIVLPFMNREIKYVDATARVVRVWEKDGRRIASLQFEHIGQFERQCIVRFCFERQLQLRNGAK